MFDNIGSKIKTLARVICWIGIIVSIISGCVLMVQNEAGLYSLLFALQPTKARGVSEEYIEKRCAELKAFKRWITHEVIPTIRKTGGYVNNEDTALKPICEKWGLLYDL